MQIAVSDDLIRKAVLESVKSLDLVPREKYEEKKISLDEFRKRYCLNHSKTWVRNMIFDRFPDTWYQNGGWAINPSGKEPGIRGTWIRIADATTWLKAHDGEIDWNEQLA